MNVIETLRTGHMECPVANAREEIRSYASTVRSLSVSACVLLAPEIC